MGDEETEYRFCYAIFMEEQNLNLR